MTRTRWRAAAVTLTIVGGGLPWALPAHADDAIRAEVYQTVQVQLEEVSARYVVLVDTSGSMARGNLYGKVSATLTSFVRIKK